jgi:hypothetical protein
MKWEGINFSTVVEVALGFLLATIIINLLFKKKSESYDAENYDTETYEAETL